MEEEILAVVILEVVTLEETFREVGLLRYSFFNYVLTVFLIPSSSLAGLLAGYLF